MIGFVTLEKTGSAAALFYIMGYMLMVLACFVVICHVSRDGENVAIADLAGLHKRSPLLAVTLGWGCLRWQVSRRLSVLWASLA